MVFDKLIEVQYQLLDIFLLIFLFVLDNHILNLNIYNENVSNNKNKLINKKLKLILESL